MVDPEQHGFELAQVHGFLSVVNTTKVTHDLRLVESTEAELEY